MSNIDFIFDVAAQDTGDIASKQLEWARRVFAQPVKPANSINLVDLESSRIEPGAEATLYTNLQSRDSEVGVHMLDWRKAELREAIQTVRQALARRERDLSVARNRIEALEKINAAEPNPDLRHPEETFNEIRAQIESYAHELAYLQRWRPSISALDEILDAFDESGRASRSGEQLMRLLGQNFRGQARLRAFSCSFRTALMDRLPQLTPYNSDKGVSSFLLQIDKGKRPVVIEARTAAYLRHCLETIAQLAALTKEWLRARAAIDDAEWFPVCALLRAIVEFFYFCNFELPYVHTDLSVDTEDPGTVWSFNDEQQSWQRGEEQRGTSRHLKRISLETALLLAENGELLKHCARDELNRFLKREAPVAETPPFYPYASSGLADFDFDASSQRVKLHTAFRSVGLIIEQIVTGQPLLQPLAKSALGGALETLVGMCELDARAFSLDSDTSALAGLERYKLLARFWRALGRHRAISMLGDDYVKRVTKGMQALGEPGPEHPTFLSVILKPTMVSVMAGGEEASPDPFGSLMLADQVRLVEMLNITWRFADEFLERLKDVHSQGKLKRVLESLPQTSADYRAELQKRLNPKWVSAKHWIWSLLRSCAPEAWAFWSKLADEHLWQKYTNCQPLAGLAQLLCLFSETARLMLLVEVSGSAIGERLVLSAETASQTIMAGAQGYAENGPMPAALSEAVNYYFDPEVRFDTWLAFTVSFRAHLHQIDSDLRAMKASEPHVRGLAGIITQFDALYPSSSTAPPPAPEVVTIPPAAAAPDIIGAITEADAELFSRIYYELLAQGEGEVLLFLKLLSMLARRETQEFLYCADRIHPLITRLLPDQRQRQLLFSLPTSTAPFFRYLQSLEEEGSLKAHELASLRERARDYFEQLEAFLQSLTDITVRLPNLLPADREAIANFLRTDDNRDLPFLMLFAADQLIMDICASAEDRRYQVESAIGKMRAFLRGQMGAHFEEPSIELFPIGGGRIARREGQLFLMGHNESFEFAFAEPDQAMSNYLISRIASIKFSFAAQILRRYFPERHFIAQI